ncbi:uncharacterized protein DSM5745_09317 [Aspergillus mulundensis]|uniref:Aminoglycoside phosphotransferase domain-containing protein n=1 Tax=Aspergillus mulundensis TaxID=1810919 RepID=A0A3D8R0L3_9EURO|nr:Uncharacterized protein DSM5745_09317 [Aspergillus mulundensis]RDW67451.1 Uncharacterized protein DSM5745_09317 [Aspergillus mulundensis]
MASEHSTIQLIQKESKIRTPRVHMLELDANCPVKAPFMLMDCLPGNVGMDLDMKIPPERKSAVFEQMAEIHIEMFHLRLPKIGIVVGVNKDGSYRQGPIPGLGGPFDTAADYFRAWAKKTKFGLSKNQLQEAAGSHADEILESTSSFLTLIHKAADRLSLNNNGPFPLCHGDFGHNNMVFDDSYRSLGVIDWEAAFAAPYEISGEFPLSLSVVPPAIDVPWDYDEGGRPKRPEDIERFADRDTYIAIVKQKEEELGLSGECLLSKILEDSDRQYLASALRLYKRGKPAWYSRLMEGFLKHEYA